MTLTSSPGTQFNPKCNARKKQGAAFLQGYAETTTIAGSPFAAGGDPASAGFELEGKKSSDPQSSVGIQQNCWPNEIDDPHGTLFTFDPAPI